MKKAKILFKKIHTDFVSNLVEAIKKQNSIKHFIHFSSLGVKSGTEVKISRK